MLTLALDTATGVATSALVSDGELVAERASRAVRVLADVAELVEERGEELSAVSAIVAGTGPGSFTGVRIGIAAARSLALALDVPLAGVSTLDALAAGAPGAIPLIDGGRREVFTLADGQPVVVKAHELRVERGSTYVGDGAVRYRELVGAAGGEVPPRESELHVPRALFHARLAHEFGAPELVEPLYLRVPDAEQAALR